MTSASEIPESLLQSLSREAAERLQNPERIETDSDSNPTLSGEQAQQLADRARAELGKRHRTQGE